MVRSFIKNKSGVAYTWAVGACSLIACGILYLALKTVLDYMVANVFASDPFTGSTLTTWNLIINIASALPAISLFIVILWGQVHAKAQTFREP
jgi:hypothetical protein